VPVRAKAGSRLDGRLQRIGSELYVGVLMVALVVFTGSAVVVALSHLSSFITWVALND
jgi:hypothetical protein